MTQAAPLILAMLVMANMVIWSVIVVEIPISACWIQGYSAHATPDRFHACADRVCADNGGTWDGDAMLCRGGPG